MRIWAILMFIVILLLLLLTQLTYAGEVCQVEGLKRVVETIIYEGASEPFEGQVAIGAVIRNRAEKGGKSFFEVVTAPKQFSCWNSAVQRDYTDKEYSTAKDAWEVSEYSKLPATHYARHDCNVYWKEHMKYLCRIGDHEFYLEQ